MSYQVLARKYRPSNFSEVVGQTHVVQALSNSITQDRIHQAFIFGGTRGVGKTTLARILAKCLNCQSQDTPVSKPCDNCSNCEEIRIGRSLDFFEQDAASQRGIDAMKELLHTVPQSPSSGRYKVYLLDEAHMLTKESFNALLKTLEEPPSHVVFILATTDPDRIPKTVLSRCLQLNLKTISQDLLAEHLNSLIKKEKIEADIDALNLIAEAANGSVRDALTLLDQAIAHGAGSLNLDEVKSLLGTIDNTYLYSMIKSVISGDGENAFHQLDSISQLNPEYDQILQSMITILHNIALEQVLKNSDLDEVKELATLVEPEFCQLLYEIAVKAYAMFHVHPKPKEAMEICLLRMLAFNPVKDLNQDINISSGIEKKNKKITKTFIDKKFIENIPKATEDQKTIDDVEVLKELDQELKAIEAYSDWNRIYESLELSPFAEAIFGNLEFISHEKSLITLRGDIEKSSIPNNVLKEFEDACTKILKVKIVLKFETGSSDKSPENIKLQESNIKQSAAETSIEKDVEIQNIIKKYNGKIQKDSIKSLD
jgi:DNA polymerase-3 subunit gamma/tau